MRSPRRSGTCTTAAGYLHQVLDKARLTGFAALLLCLMSGGGFGWEQNTWDDRFRLAAKREVAGDLEGAVTLLAVLAREAAEFDGDDQRPYLALQTLGVNYLQLGRYFEAEKCFLQADAALRSTHPKNWQLHLLNQ